MGTRNLTAVFIDGEYKVAQYGQWDGYPEGQGLICLHFLRDEMDEERFKQAVRNCRYLTQADLDLIYDEYTDANGCMSWDDHYKFSERYPWLSRDTGAQVLAYIQQHNGCGLKDSITFAANSLFCEWAWIVDFDARTFEAFAGFNTDPLTQEDRFYFLRNYEREDLYGYDAFTKYAGVKLVAKFSLDDLPSDEDFINSFKEEN